MLYGLNPDTLEIEPTFADVFRGTLSPTCGANDGCHFGPSPQRGLSFDDEDTAYELLMDDATTGAPRVVPGDLRCGEVIFRLETDDETEVMPPGSRLEEPEICAIRHWIANGAPR